MAPERKCDAYEEAHLRTSSRRKMQKHNSARQTNSHFDFGEYVVKCAVSLESAAPWSANCCKSSCRHFPARDLLETKAPVKPKLAATCCLTCYSKCCSVVWNMREFRFDMMASMHFDASHLGWKGSEEKAPQRKIVLSWPVLYILQHSVLCTPCTSLCHKALVFHCSNRCTWQPAEFLKNSLIVRTCRLYLLLCLYHCNQELKDRITPHVNNCTRRRLSIDQQQGKTKYESDGGWVCVCVCMYVHVQACHFASVCYRYVYRV